MKKKILLPALALFGMLTGGLSSCGPKDPSSPEGPSEETYGNGKVQLTVWAPAEQFQIYSSLVTEYNKTADPEKTVKLKVVGIGEGDIGEKFGNDPTKGPDVFQIPGNDISSFVTKGFISQLDVAGREDISITSETLKTGMVQSALYALPYTINTYFLYYNTSQLEETQVESLSTIIAAAKEANKQAFGFKISDGFYFQAVLRAMGLDIYGEGGTSNSSSDFTSTNEAAVWATRFSHELLTNETLYNTEYATFINELRDGKILSVVDGTWNFGNYKDALGENFGCAILPKIDITLDGHTYDNQLGAPIDNKFVVVNSSLKGEKFDVAKDFAYYTVSDAAQKIKFELKSIIPTADKLLNDEDFKKTFLMAGAVSDYNKSTANFSNPTATKFNANFWGAIEGFCASIKTVSPSGGQYDFTKAIDELNAALLK